MRLALLLCALAAACSAPSGGFSGADPQADLARQMAAEGIYPESTPARVTLKDHRSGATIGLLNRAHTDSSALYSEVRTQLVYKVIPDLDMGALMKQLEQYDYFAAALRSEARVPGARTTIQVERGGQVYTMAYTPESAQEVVDRMQQCSAAIQYVYNKHQAYQVIDNQVGESYFQDANRDAKAAQDSR